jgi:lipoprotein-releasing system ATP-binding protein
MAEPVLVVEQVHMAFDGEEVLHGVDLALGRGELCALLGPSGSGKSTLLNVIGCLERPTGGRVLIRGEDATRLDGDGLTRLRGEALGFVFQFHHLLPAFTVVENVLLPAYARRGWPDPAERGRAVRMLERVGLADRLDSRPTELSGGQQQRVAVARALAHDPPLVLADEPTGNLDTHTADALFTLLRDINRERGTTFLVVTHDPRLAARCDRRIELVDGQILSDSANG